MRGSCVPQRQAGASGFALRCLTQASKNVQPVIFGHLVLTRIQCMVRNQPAHEIKQIKPPQNKQLSGTPRILWQNESKEPTAAQFKVDRRRRHCQEQTLYLQLRINAPKCPKSG